MASRKDLLKAQTFTSQRLVKALVNRSPDGLDAPLRRASMGTFASVMVSVLMVAAFGIIGWIHPGSSQKWKADKTVVVDTDAGVVFAYLGDSLYPAYNITSAKLATGGGPTVRVKSKSLAHFPRKPEIGIPDAPAELPDPTLMDGYPIQLCSSAPKAKSRFITVEIGGSVPPPSGNPAVAVQDSAGGDYLVIEGRIHQVPNSQTGGAPLLNKLGFIQSMQPGNAFLRGLPAGTPLSPPKIPRLGTRSSSPSGKAVKVGDVLQDTTANTSYVLLSDGMTPITDLQAAELEVTTRQSQPYPVDANTAAASRSATKIIPPADLPAKRPDPTQAPADTGSSSVCATWTDNDKPPRLSFGDPTPEVTSHAGSGAADKVVMAPVTGALLQPNSATGDANISLITDGKRYGLADATARTAIGYGTSRVLRVPDQLLSLIPGGLKTGVLSIEAASPPKQ